MTSISKLPSPAERADEIVLIARQRAKLAEGSLFIAEATRWLEDTVGMGALSPELYGFLGIDTSQRLYRALIAVSEALRKAADHERLEPANLSLCVFTVAMLADELERAGMSLDLARLDEALPALAVGWCRTQYQAKCVGAMTVAGRA